MSNSGLNLGDAFAQVGYKYDATGAGQFLTTSAQIEAALKRIAALQQQTGVTATQAAAAQTAAGTATSNAARQQQQLANVLLQQQLATANTTQKVDILTARMGTLTQGTLAYEQMALRLIRTQQQLTREQDAAAAATTRAATAAATAAARQQAAATGPAVLPRTFAGFTQNGLTQIAGALGVTSAASEFVDLEKRGFTLRAELDLDRRSLGSLFNDVARGNQVFADAAKFAEKYAFTQKEIGQAALEAAPILKATTASTEQTLEVLARLQAKQPDKSLSDAVRAVTELQAGQLQSLERIFNIPQQMAQTLKAQIEAGADPVKALGVLLDKLGISNDLLSQRTKGTTGELNNLKRAIEELAIELSTASDGPVAKFIGGIESLTEKLTAYLKVQRGVAVAPDAFASAALKGIAARSSNFEEFNRNLIRQTGADLLSTDVGKNLEGLQLATVALSRAQFDAIKSTDGHTAAEAHHAEELQNAADATNALTAATQALDHAAAEAHHAEELRAGTGLASLGSTFLGGARDPMADARNADTITAGRERAQNEAENQKKIEDATIKTDDDIVAHHKQATGQLDDLDQAHKDRVQEIGDNLKDGLQKLDDERTAAVKKGTADRIKLEQDGKDAIAALVATHTQQLARTEEDQRIADAHETRDFNEQQQAALESYQDQRQKLIDSQHKREAESTAQAARDEQRAREQAQEQEITGTAAFVERLFQQTRQRGGGGAKARAEANSQLAQARREAEELAKTDAAAGAAYLAARQRQILEDLSANAGNKQLLKDARRGGAFGTAAAQDEIAQEGQARKDANAAELDQIKKQAQERADDKKRGHEAQLASDKEQLDTLEKSYNDQHDKAIAAEKERQGDRDAARKLEAGRREADYKAQLGELEANNRQKLKDFDDQQKARIQQIDDQTEALKAATKKQLDQVDGKYKEARDKITTDDATFAAERKQALQDQANDLKLTPDEEHAKQYADAMFDLGKSGADAFKAGFESVVGNDARHSGGEVPATPGEARAAGAIISGGKIISNFGADRSFLPGHSKGDIHQGFDVGGQEGMPIHALFGGTIHGPFTNQFGGNVAFIDGEGQYKGLTAYYAHMKGPALIRSGHVSAGQTIGLVGTSGDAAGGPAHVHVEIIQNGVDLDPSQALAGYTPPSVPAPRRGGDVQAQRLSGFALDRTLPATQRLGTASTAATSITHAPQLIVDLKGAVFTDVSMAQVEHVVRSGVISALNSQQAQYFTDIAHIGTGGPLR